MVTVLGPLICWEDEVHYLSLFDYAEVKAIKIHADSVMNAVMLSDGNFNTE